MENKVLRKIIASTILVALVIGMMPLYSRAEDGVKEYYFDSKVPPSSTAEKVCEVYKYNIKMGKVVGLVDLQKYLDNGWKLDTGHGKSAVDLEKIVRTYETKEMDLATAKSNPENKILGYNIWKSAGYGPDVLVIKGTQDYASKLNQGYVQNAKPVYTYYKTIRKVSIYASDAHRQFASWKNLGQHGNEIWYGSDLRQGYKYSNSNPYYYLSRGGWVDSNWVVMNKTNKTEKYVTAEEYEANYKNWNIKSVKVNIPHDRKESLYNVTYQEALLMINQNKTVNITYKVVASRIFVYKENFNTTKWMTNQEAWEYCSTYRDKNNYSSTDYKIIDTATRWKITDSGKATLEKYQEQEKEKEKQQQQQQQQQQQNQPKNTEEAPKAPEEVEFELTEEAYKEYIKNLFEAVEKTPTEDEINSYITKKIGTTTTEILKEKENLSNEEFIQMIKTHAIHISEDKAVFAKILTYLNNSQITKKDAVLLILDNKEVQEIIKNYYEQLVEENSTKEGLTVLDPEEEKAARIERRGSTIDAETLKFYLAESYSLLSNEPDAENHVEIDSDNLNSLIEFYNNGYDVEDCIIDLINNKGVLNNEVLSKKSNEELAKKLYEAIIFKTPNDYNLHTLTQWLDKGETKENVVRRIVKSPEFKQLKNTLINKEFNAEVRMEEYEEIKVSVETFGDLDGDGKITCGDAQLLLNVITDASLGHEDNYADKIAYLDINGDETVDIDDALLLLNYYVEVELAGSKQYSSLGEYITAKK